MRILEGYCFNCGEHEAQPQFNNNDYCFTCQNAYERGYEIGKHSRQAEVNRLWAMAEGRRQHPAEQELQQQLLLVRRRLELLAKPGQISQAALKCLLDEWWHDNVKTKWMWILDNE